MVTMTAAGAALAQGNPPPAEAMAPPGGTLPSNEKRLRIINLRDLEAEAQRVMTPYGFAYVAGGAGDEWTMRENIASFNRTVIVPHFLGGTGTPNTTTELLGIKLPFPVIAAPVGFQGSMHAQKELPTVKGAGAAGTLYVASSVMQLSLEDIAAATAGDKWFQPYLPNSRPFAVEMLQRAKAAGYKAIVLTVDAPIPSNRERSTRLIGVPVPNLALGNVPKTPGVTGNAMAMKANLSWDDVAFCREQTGLPVIVKGILSASQALEAERNGCAAVWLSNHGGRQLDNTPSAMTVLPRVATALKGRLPIIVSRSGRFPRDRTRGIGGSTRPPPALRVRPRGRPRRSKRLRAPAQRIGDDHATRRNPGCEEHRAKLRGACRGVKLKPRMEMPDACRRRNADVLCVNQADRKRTGCC